MLKLACASRSIDLGGESGLETLGFTAADVADFTFGAFGFPDRVVSVDDDCLHVELGCPSMTGVTVAVGAMLAAVSPHSFQTIEVTLPDRTTWRCPLDPYAAFRRESGDFHKQLALMRIQICWKMDDGVPRAGSQAVKKWVATQVTETMSLDTSERFRRLRSLREFAEEAAEAELAATLQEEFDLV